MLKFLDLSFCPEVKYKARARLVYAQAMTGAVLFQFSRYPQFLTAGFGVSIGSDRLYIYKQLLVNCTAKLLKIVEMGSLSWLGFPACDANGVLDMSFTTN